MKNYCYLLLLPIKKQFDLIIFEKEDTYLLEIKAKIDKIDDNFNKKYINFEQFVQKNQSLPNSLVFYISEILSNIYLIEPNDVFKKDVRKNVLINTCRDFIFIFLRDIRYMSYREIGELMNTSYSHIHSKIIDLEDELKNDTKKIETKLILNYLIHKNYGI